MTAQTHHPITGQWQPVLNPAEVALTVEPDIEGLRATIQDFLEGSLPGFGFAVPDTDIEKAVDRLVAALEDTHVA